MHMSPPLGPAGWRVAESGIHDPAAAIGLRPRQCVIAVGALTTTDVDGTGIEPQQDVDRRPRPVSELIDLVIDLEGVAQVARGGVRPILDDEPCTLGPGVPVEGAAQELTVLPARGPGIRGAAHADESPAVSRS